MTRNKHQNTQAFRAGARLGRVWRSLGRLEKHFVQWLSGHGCPPIVATGLAWIVGLTALGVLLYISVIVAVFLIAALLVTRILAHAELSTPEKTVEWRNGLLGFGLYNQNGWRVDPHDPSDPFRDP